MRKSSPRKSISGQSLVEYLILVAIMAVASVGIVRLLNHTVTAQFARVTRVLQGDTSTPVNIERVDESLFRKKDMGDFIRGGASPRRSSRGQ